MKKVKIPVAEKRICKVCKIGKMRNKISKILAPHKREPLELISFDIAGPFPTSLRGNRYFLQVVDSWSRRLWSIPLKTKDQAIHELRKLKLREEKQTGKMLKAARSDNAPELKNVMEQWQREDGVIAEFTAVASSHQNGPAERSIQTAEMAIRTMICDAELPIEFWDEAVEYDSYIRNRLPVGPIVDGKLTSPIEAYTGLRPNVDHIRPWGYKAYGYVNPKTLELRGRHDKLVVRGREGVFMGFSDNTEKHAKIYAPDLGRVERVNAFLIDEKVKGGTINLKLKETQSGSQGTPNQLPQRKKRGRPRKDQEIEEKENDNMEGITINFQHTPVLGPKFISQSESQTESQQEPQPAPLAASISVSQQALMPTSQPASLQNPSGAIEIITKPVPSLPKSMEHTAELSTDPDKTNSKRNSKRRQKKKKLTKTEKNDPNANKPSVKMNNDNDNEDDSDNDNEHETKNEPEMSNESIIIKSPEKRNKIQTLDVNESMDVDPSIEAAPRYFFRNRKRKGLPSDQEDGKERKRIRRALIAGLAYPAAEGDNDNHIIRALTIAFDEQEWNIESALPAQVINGISIPKTYKQAVNDKVHGKLWKEAISNEIEALVSNRTWEEHVLPRGANLVSTKWVFTVKLKNDGTVERYKARLVARGFSQQFGIDYTETFAPTARMDTFRLFFAMVAKFNLECHHYDIKNAFTESTLQEDIFLAPPEGVNVSEGKVLKAMRSLYGLKQAGRDWNLLLKGFLVSIGLEKSRADPCLYVHHGKQIWILVYVDDIAAAAKDKGGLNWFFSKLS
ncbi:hypothetical protein K3495_g14309, partial [Podosphaera aphanis]